MRREQELDLPDAASALSFWEDTMNTIVSYCAYGTRRWALTPSDAFVASLVAFATFGHCWGFDGAEV